MERNLLVKKGSLGCSVCSLWWWVFGTEGMAHQKCQALAKDMNRMLLYTKRQTY